MFDRTKNLSLYKSIIILLGSVAFTFAVSTIEINIFDWRFVSYVTFTLLIASRMSIVLPRSKLIISFADSMIFLTFLLFGGEAAIIISGLEAFTNCLYLRRNKIYISKLNIFFNISAITISTTITYSFWTILTKFNEFNSFSSITPQLISILGVLALTQFFGNSMLVSIVYSLENNIGVWQTWKTESYSSSLTYIVGAGLAGVIYKLISLGDVVPVAVALLVFAVIYFTFRQSVSQLSNSEEKAEQAERARAEAEKLRAEQAEQHIEVLNEQLAKEEQISEALQQSKDAFEYAALHDSLTNLFNRSYLIERIELLLEIGIQKSNQYFILFLDLSRFKNINDSLGHNIGDKVLKLVANRLLRTVSLEDTVARIGGDEFAIILNNLNSVEEAESYARKIYQKLSSPFSVHGNRIFSKPHIGIAPLDQSYQTPEEILRDADIAMHHAKEKEVGVAIFNAEIRDKFLDKIKLESDLRFAVERKEFLMYYQPIINLEDGSLAGFEALLRWQHPRRGMVSPGEFIPIAEDSGLIIPITNWILHETTEQLRTWQRMSPANQNLIISVNISGKHLNQDGLIEEVRKTLKTSGINPYCLKLEITESVAMQNAEKTIVILNKLKELGVQLSIDDFGTGYSSLNYLHRLPFDTLKIDRSFVSVVRADGENSEILQTIITLAKNLKMRSVAEGIETESQLQILRDLNCDLAQGYLFAKPLPKEEMDELLYHKHFWFPQSFYAEVFDSQPSAETDASNRQHLSIH